MIDVRLKVFISVARNLSFTKASQELFISQPAISKHIKELESEYNTCLFERMGTHIQLTKPGKILLDNAEVIIQQYKKMNFDMNNIQKKYGGSLRIGASTTIAQYVLPEMLAKFMQLYPDITINTISDNSRNIEQMLKDGRIDVGMVEGISRQPELRYTNIMKDELVAIVHEGSKMSELDEIDLETFKKTPIVIREHGSGSLQVIEKYLHENNIRLSDLNIIMSFGTTEGIKHFVEHTEAMGIISIMAVSHEIIENRFKIIELKGLKMMRNFAYVEKRGESIGLQKLFKQFIINSYKA
jgi:DNA-binding transcriptional LysR family regulator